MIDLKIICETLNKNRIQYLIIGGDAAVYYGSDRVSLDYDIWIKNNDTTYKKVINVLIELGYIKSDSYLINGNKKVKRWQLLKNHKLNRFYTENEKPIDILSKNIKYKQFESCYKRRNVVMIDNIEFSFISKKDLITLKKQAGRKKDIDDIESLKK